MNLRSGRVLFSPLHHKKTKRTRTQLDNTRRAASRARCLDQNSIWTYVDSPIRGAEHGFDGAVVCSSMTADGTHLALVCSSNSAIKVWNIATNTVVHTLDMMKKHDPNVVLSWNLDGTQLACGYHTSGEVQTWDLNTNVTALVDSWHERDAFCRLYFTPMALSWDSSGSMLAISSAKHIAIWNTLSKHIVTTTKLREQFSVDNMSWQPGKPVLAYTERSESLHLWSIALTTQNKENIDIYDGCCSVSWHPDGVLLMTGHRNGTIQIWDTTTRLLLNNFGGHYWFVISVAWHPDGDKFASLSRDSLHIWEMDMNNNSPTLVFTTPSRYKRNCTYTNTGSLIVYDSINGIRVYHPVLKSTSVPLVTDLLNKICRGYTRCIPHPSNVLSFL